MFRRAFSPVFVLALGAATSAAAAPATPSRDVAAAVSRMRQAARGSLELTHSPVSGVVSFLRAQDAGIPVDASAATAAGRATAFLKEHGRAFGLEPGGVELVRSWTDALGMEHARFRQTVAGVPVTGGEVTVHLRGALVTAVNARALPDAAGIDTVPAMPAGAATSAAATLLEELDVRGAVLSEPRLEVLNRGLLEGRPQATRLAWLVEATAPARRELIWVDARRGRVLLHFDNLPHARNRLVYNANNGSVLPGTLVRTEGGPATGDLDADRAYDYAGHTYDYFWNYHGRDSFDGAGATIASSVHFCPSAANCPYENAFWNGARMVYGEGFSRADDVVAHELTHAVTERTANLFYYMQSGALNESFSDIFGESVDLVNGAGNDTPAQRWLLGEDLSPYGANRSLMNPNQFGDPGRMSDSAYFYCLEGDGGGVHTNSGVPNHAFALMVDGGSYNGYTVAAIGFTAAGAIQYRALTTYLLTASDFLDNDNALRQSCADLVGTSGITAGTCTEVGKALDAVQMRSTWPCAPTQPAVPTACPAGQALGSTLFSDNLESISSGNWTTVTAVGLLNAWDGGAGTPGIYWPYFATSGVWAFWGYDFPSSSDSSVQMTASVPLPANARMSFAHSYDFERNFDGGVVEYSTNGGASWADAGPLFAAGAAYDGTSSGTPLGSRSMFQGPSWGYTASQLDLSSLAGQSVRFRFRIGTDITVGDEGWFIDDVRIHTCIPLTAAVSDAAAVTEGNAGSTQAVFTVTLSGTSDGTASVTYSTANGTATWGSDYTLTSGTLTFPAGAASATIAVPVLGDALDEPNETFVLNLTGGNVTITDGQGQATILDDDPDSEFRIDDAAVAEGNAGSTMAAFTVTMAPSAQIRTVAYQAVAGTATAGVDFTAVSGTLTFTPGVSSQPISVPVLGDVGVEADETFVVNLSGSSGPPIADSQGLGTILDDDAPSLSSAELTHGAGQEYSLASTGVADLDYFRVAQAPYSSYEAIVDATSGDVSPIVLERLDADNATVLGSGVATGTGSARSLRWRNALSAPVVSHHLRVRSGGCTTTCGADDVYRIRFYDTTFTIPRFNNSGSQMTVVILQNPGTAAVTGAIHFWSAAGSLLATQPFTVAARATLVLNTATLALLSGTSGAVTVAHDGGYGALAGKAVALEPATGFSFDSPMVPLAR